MSTHQFALRALDGIALFHCLAERLALLLHSPRLQRRIMPSHHQRPMLLAWPHTALAQRTVVAVRAPLESEIHLAALLLFQPAARSEEHTSELQSRGHLV